MTVAGAAARIVLAGFLLAECTACSKASGIEGRVEDGQGRPISGLTLVAGKAGEPPASVVTDADGRFRFAELSPSTPYLIMPRAERWSTSASITASSGRWSMVQLKRPFLIRFSEENGVVRDSLTGLEWRPDPGQTFTWSEAYDLVTRNALDGWRLPTEQELMDLYAFRSRRKMIRIDDAFRLANTRVWTSERIDQMQDPDGYFTLLADQSSQRGGSLGGMLDVPVADRAAYLDKMAARRMDLPPFVRYFDFHDGSDGWLQDTKYGTSLSVLFVRMPGTAN